MLAKEYAKAIYDSTDNLEEFTINFDSFVQGLSENLEYVKLMDSKFINKQEKKDLLTKLVSDDLLYLLYVLVDNDRFTLIFDIHKEFTSLKDKHNNIMRLSLTSSYKLSDNELSLVKSHFENVYKKNISIDTFIDETLISGLKVEFDGKLLETSILNDMIKLKQKLTKEVI